MSAAAAHEIPDPLLFTSDAIAARGALVEAVEGGCLAVLPPGLARELDVPENCTFAADASHAPEEAVSCAIGSPILDRLGASARASVPFAALASAAEPPRPGQARSLAERFGLRNAIFEVTAASVADTHYVVAWFAWRAEADDRYDGMFALALHAGDGSEPDASLASLVESGVERARADPRAVAAPGAEPGDRRPRGPARDTGRRVSAVAAASAAVARRHARDGRRIDEYFTALARDARAPKRRVEPAAIEQKIAHLARERDAKLHDLAERYALRVSLEPVALVALTVPAARVQVRVRRRKREGELVLRLPATAGSLDRLTCAACGGSTARPAVCDDALHVLCEACVPQAQGRPDCGAC